MRSGRGSARGKQLASNRQAVGFKKRLSNG